MMTKKERVSYMMRQIESIMHKLIDDGADEPFKMFDLLAITMDTFIKESQRPKPIMRFKISDS